MKAQFTLSPVTVRQQLVFYLNPRRYSKISSGGGSNYLRPRLGKTKLHDSSEHQHFQHILKVYFWSRSIRDSALKSWLLIFLISDWFFPFWPDNISVHLITVITELCTSPSPFHGLAGTARHILFKLHPHFKLAA